MDNRKKLVIYSTIVFVVLLILVLGASYAYFQVSSTNSFGSKTISATTPALGSVSLVGDNNSLSLNLRGSDMMKKTGDVTYYGTTSGVPTTDVTSVQLAHTTVSGAGTFNCSYTLNVAATGTNNLYTAFQGWGSKSYGQILLNINGTDYDFRTTNLFPITINGTLNGVSSSKPKYIEASVRMVNKYSLNQDVLQNKDITITITATSFSCSVATPVYYVYDANKSYPKISDPLTTNNGLDYYIMGYSGSSYDEVCGIFSGTEYCLDPSYLNKINVAKTEMEALGLTCTMYDEDAITCGSFSSVWCSVNADIYGTVSCGSYSSHSLCAIGENSECSYASV